MVEVQKIKDVECIFQKIGGNQIRMTGDFSFVQTLRNEKGEVTSYSANPGPSVWVGGKIKFGGLNWTITNIAPDPSSPKHESLYEVVLTVKPTY